MQKNRFFKFSLCLITAFASSLVAIGAVENNDTVFGSDSELNGDSFYVLDENGNVSYIEPDQNELKKLQESQENESYQLVVNDKVVEEFDSHEEAVNEYSKYVTSSKKGRSLVSPEISLMSNDNIVALSETQNASIVRFKIIVKKNSSGNYYVDNTAYTEVLTGRDGYLNVSSASDAAYIKTNADGSIMCKVGGVLLNVSSSLVESIQPYNTDLYSYYSIANGFLIHTYSHYNYNLDKFVLSSTRVGYQPSYLNVNTTYFSYDGHYFYTDFSKMIVDYRNNTYSNAVNKSAPYYNYYQYLSLRSKTTIAASQFNSRVNTAVTSNKKDPTTSKLYNKGDYIISAQNSYGVNAASIFGVACNESAYGTSSIALSKNNIFGLNAVDSNTGNASTFNSPEDCIKDFAVSWMSNGYLDPLDSRYRGPHFGDKSSGINVKYASDPYWGEKAASQPYFIDTNKTDYGKYSIGMALTTELYLYKEPTKSSKNLYTSGVVGSGKAGYSYDYPVIILERLVGSDGELWYKIQSDVPLKDDRSAINRDTLYKYDRDYAYAKASEISVIYEGNYTGLSHAEILTKLNVKNSSNILSGFAEKGTVDNLVKTIVGLNPNASVSVSHNNIAVTSGQIKSGMQMTVKIGDVNNQYILIIRGDVSGDGQILANDYFMIKAYKSNQITFTNYQLKAADVDNMNGVNSADYFKLKDYKEGKYKIIQ